MIDDSLITYIREIHSKVILIWSWSVALVQLSVYRKDFSLVCWKLLVFGMYHRTQNVKLKLQRKIYKVFWSLFLDRSNMEELRPVYIGTLTFPRGEKIAKKLSIFYIQFVQSFIISAFFLSTGILCCIKIGIFKFQTGNCWKYVPIFKAKRWINRVFLYSMESTFRTVGESVAVWNFTCPWKHYWISYLLI